MKARIWFKFCGIPGSIQVDLDVPSMDSEVIQKTLQNHVDTQLKKDFKDRIDCTKPQIVCAIEQAC